nr:hypothetical protein [uncultured Carboxylicivirga sp.]
MRVKMNDTSFDELKTKLKNKFPLLNDGDLTITKNNTALMLRIVAFKLRKSKEEMAEIVENL